VRPANRRLPPKLISVEIFVAWPSDHVLTRDVVMFKFCWPSVPPLILMSRLGIGFGPLSKLIGRITGKPEVGLFERHGLHGLLLPNAGIY
jgi:hypothetical protein